MMDVNTSIDFSEASLSDSICLELLAENTFSEDVKPVSLANYIIQVLDCCKGIKETCFETSSNHSNVDDTILSMIQNQLHHLRSILERMNHIDLMRPYIKSMKYEILTTSLLNIQSYINHLLSINPTLLNGNTIEIDQSYISNIIQYIDKIINETILIQNYINSIHENVKKKSKSIMAQPMPRPEKFKLSMSQEIQNIRKLREVATTSSSLQIYAIKSMTRITQRYLLKRVNHAFTHWKLFTVHCALQRQADLELAMSKLNYIQDRYNMKLLYHRFYHWYHITHTSSTTTTTTTTTTTKNHSKTKKAKKKSMKQINDEEGTNATHTRTQLEREHLIHDDYDDRNISRNKSDIYVDDRDILPNTHMQYNGIKDNPYDNEDMSRYMNKTKAIKVNNGTNRQLLPRSSDHDTNTNKENGVNPNEYYDHQYVLDDMNDNYLQKNGYIYNPTPNHTHSSVLKRNMDNENRSNNGKSQPLSSSITTNSTGPRLNDTQFSNNKMMNNTVHTTLSKNENNDYNTLVQLQSLLRSYINKQNDEGETYYSTQKDMRVHHNDDDNDGRRDRYPSQHIDGIFDTTILPPLYPMKDIHCSINNNMKKLTMNNSFSPNITDTSLPEVPSSLYRSKSKNTSQNTHTNTIFHDNNDIKIQTKQDAYHIIRMEIQSLYHQLDKYETSYQQLAQQYETIAEQSQETNHILSQISSIIFRQP